MSDAGDRFKIVELWNVGDIKSMVPFLVCLANVSLEICHALMEWDFDQF